MRNDLLIVRTTFCVKFLPPPPPPTPLFFYQGPAKKKKPLVKNVEWPLYYFLLNLHEVEPKDCNSPQQQFFELLLR